MRLVLTTIFILFCHCLFSQVRFEKAYIINEEGEKIDCLIKNKDWNFCPSKIQCKFEKDGEIVEFQASDILEFGFANKSNYKSRTVQIDQSASRVEFFSTQRSPEFVEQHVFLRTIVEGNYSLYEYASSAFTRYFVQVRKGDIEQLIYKGYEVSPGVERYNYQFRQQLSNILQESSDEKNDFNDLLYKKPSLTKVIKAANENTESKQLIYKPQRKKLNLYAKIKAGQGNVRQENVFELNTNFENVYTYGAGVEIEFILPVNNNRWMIFFDPSYRLMQAEQTFNEPNDFFEEYVGKIDYAAIEIPFGVKYNINFSKNFSCYATAFAMTDLLLTEALLVNQPSGERILGENGVANNFGAGLGIRIYNRVLLEGKYYGYYRTGSFDDDSRVPFPYFSLNMGITLFSI